MSKVSFSFKGHGGFEKDGSFDFPSTALYLWGTVRMIVSKARTASPPYVGKTEPYAVKLNGIEIEEERHETTVVNAGDRIEVIVTEPSRRVEYVD